VSSNLPLQWQNREAAKAAAAGPLAWQPNPTLKIVEMTQEDWKNAAKQPTHESVGFMQIVEKAAAKPQEVRIKDEITGGEKGQKQAQLGAVDPAALLSVATVAGFGTEKYARYNFAKGYAWSLSFDALQRHLLAFWNGENNDPESKLPHLAHAAWHCLALLTFSLRKRGTDDRFPQAAPADPRQPGPELPKQDIKGALDQFKDAYEKALEKTEKTWPGILKKPGPYEVPGNPNPEAWPIPRAVRIPRSVMERDLRL
jgi:hypothetical protein